MSNEELQVSRGEGDDPAETLKAQVEAEIRAAADRVSAELAEAPPPFDWEVYALGPWQGPPAPPPGPLPPGVILPPLAATGPAPGRIIEVNETAYIVTLIWLNALTDANITAFGGKIQLNYFTSNTQTMQPVVAMDYSCCLDPGALAGVPFVGGFFYVTVYEFEPTEAACILETNICARLCNCDDEVVPGYAAFVRWISNLDPEQFLSPVTGFQFDRPIRYLVYDNDDDTNCDCSETCP
jgi:hypothetical protein